MTSPHSPDTAGLPGNLFIVAAPSGAGKSSLVRALLERDPSITVSISCTTRAPRPGEVDGREYLFVTPEAFHDLVARDQMLEWAEVHGNFYGTPRGPVLERLAQGQDVILEIDWQGAQSVRRHFPAQTGVFILPPGLDVLEQRLHTRAQDSAEIIQRRLAAAEGEMQHVHEFEYVVINQDFNVALDELHLIVRACRLRSGAQAGRHAALFAALGIAPAANATA